MLLHESIFKACLHRTKTFAFFCIFQCRRICIHHQCQWVTQTQNINISYTKYQFSLHFHKKEIYICPGARKSVVRSVTAWRFFLLLCIEKYFVWILFYIVELFKKKKDQIFNKNNSPQNLFLFVFDTKNWFAKCSIIVLGRIAFSNLYKNRINSNFLYSTIYLCNLCQSCTLQ